MTERKALALALIVMGGLLLFMWSIDLARGQHTHEGAVGKFYQDWKMPDAPQTSCCNDMDCQPAASRFVNGQWEAEFDGEWVKIPPYKIEQNRDSPDGRSHICGRKSLSGVVVFCFIRGGGT